MLDTPASKFVHPKEVVMLAEDCSVEKALETLKQHRILGAPVVSNATNQVIGLIDVLDAVSYANHLYFEEGHKLAEAWKYEAIAVSFRFQTVKNIMDYSQRNPFNPFHSETTFKTILRDFATGTHRMLMVDKDNATRGIFSQSDCIQFIASRMGADPTLREITSKTVVDMNMGRLPDIDNNIVLYAIESSEHAINAFRLMHTTGVSGIGILENGKITGNISASDLLGFLQGDFEMLQCPVSEFVDEICKKSPQYAPRFRLVTCSPSDTLAQVIQILCYERLHRIYVNDKDDIVGVITLTDVLRALYEALTGESILPKEDDL